MNLIRVFNRHPWIWVVLAYVFGGQVIIFLWPWRGWSLHLIGGGMWIALMWGIGRIGDYQSRKGIKP